jgi:hypothetical protein
MYCKHQAYVPLPMTSKTVPEIAAPRHSRRLGAGAPRARAKNHMIEPAHKKRSAAMYHGGTVATATFIAGDVEPQKT